MFQFLGNLVRRTWLAWHIGWSLLLAVLYVTAPPWNEIAQDREFGFLPEDAASRQGQALFKRAFPNDKQASNVVIVISRSNEELREEDKRFIRDLVKPALLKIAQERGEMAEDKGNPSQATDRIVTAIRTFDDPGAGALLISADRRATLVILELTTELLEYRNWPIVSKVESLLAQWRDKEQIPPDLDLKLIGSATVGRDMTLGQRQSAHATEIWTVIIVIVILLLIYRAPILAMIPLVSVFMATQLSLKLLSHLAQAGFITLFEGIEIYITVILYGTGVDYCLFLEARYTEERARGADWGDALARAIGHVGSALTASAATVMFGIGMMAFAKFG